MLEVSNVGELARQIDAWCKAAEKLAEDVGRGLTVVAFKHVLAISPQYSGDFVANWRYSIGAIDDSWAISNVTGTNKYQKTPTGLKHDGLPAEVAFKQGDWPARNAALSHNRGRDGAFKLGVTVYISNSSVHDEPYAMKIENNQIKFRDVNPNAGAPAAQAAKYIADNYSMISSSRARGLRGERL